MTTAVEIHLGWPVGSPPPVVLPFTWKEVAEAEAGRASTGALEGHSVDGRLGAIGTARAETVADLDDIAAALLGAGITDPACRLEVEIDADDETDTVLDRIQEVVEHWVAVAAPSYEVHVSVPTASLVELAELARRGQVALFESTRFVGRQTSVATIVGDTVEEVRSDADRFIAACMRRGMQPTKVVAERVVGAWRPAGGST